MKKINDAFLSAPEAVLIEIICKHLPASIKPDHLTAIGLAGGILVFTGFALSPLDPNFLWLSSLGLLVNWTGDSLDGSLARFRKSERYPYGFFLDHMTDSFVMTIIGLGAGLSPSLSMNGCLFVLVAYLLLTIFSLLNAKANNIMRISFGRLGPTEFRIFLLGLIVCIYNWPGARINLGTFSASLYDIILYILAASLALICVMSAVKTARQLGAAAVEK